MMTAMLLTAGLGTRFRPHTEKIAKPALPFLNIPLMAWPYFYLEAIGVKNIGFNTHLLPNSVEHAAQHLQAPGHPWKAFHETPEILGSGGGVYNAKELLSTDSDFFVVNGDEVLIATYPEFLADFLAHHKKEQALASLLVCHHPEAGKRFGAVWVDSQQQVIHFGKQALEPHLKPLHYLGYLILNKEIFSFMTHGPSNILYDILTSAIKAKQKVLTYSISDIYWHETGSLKDYLQATKAILEILGQSRPQTQVLHKILQRFSPGWDNYFLHGVWSHQRIQFQRDQRPSLGLLGPHVSIDPTSHLRGFCVLGSRANIGPRTLLENAVVASNTQVNDSQTIISDLLLPSA